MKCEVLLPRILVHPPGLTPIPLDEGRSFCKCISCIRDIASRLKLEPLKAFLVL
jgi:hypothetical protein